MIFLSARTVRLEHVKKFYQAKKGKQKEKKCKVSKFNLVVFPCIYELEISDFFVLLSVTESLPFPGPSTKRLHHVFSVDSQINQCLKTSIAFQVTQVPED